MTAIFEGLGNFFEASFQLFPLLGNFPNVLFIIVVSVLFLYWMGQLNKFRKANQE